MNPVWEEMQPEVGEKLISRKKPQAKNQELKKTGQNTAQSVVLKGITHLEV